MPHLQSFSSLESECLTPHNVHHTLMKLFKTNGDLQECGCVYVCVRGWGTHSGPEG